MSDFDPNDTWDALYDSKYLRWFDLKGQAALVQIVGIDKTVELTMRGGAKERKSIVYLKQIRGAIERRQYRDPATQGDIKPLVLNRINGDAIRDLYGDKPSQCIGKEIVLVEATDKIPGEKGRGLKTVPCIRIHAKKE